MLELIGVMLAILATWFISGVAVWGIGAALWRMLGGELRTPESALWGYWLGLALTIGLLQVWHLFAPVNGVSMWGLLLLGAAGLVINARAWLDLLRRSLRYPSYWIVFIVIALMAANNALLEPKRYDAGLYQIQSVLWTNSYPIVPGLGNLHGRLGFNNAFHLYIAQLNTGFLDGRGMHLANGLPLLMLAAGGLLGVWRIVERGWRMTAAYWALLLPLALRHLFTVTLYSPDNDLMALLIGAGVLGVLLQILDDPDDPQRSVWLMSLGAVIGVGVTFKLSFAVFGGVIILTLLALQIADRQPLARPLAVAVMLGLLIVGVWMWRGVMMTGYVAYPSTFGAFPVDWRMPPEIGTQESAWVRAWARMPGVLGDDAEISMPQLEGLSWVVPWLFDTFTTTPNIFDVTLPVGLALAGLAVKVWRRDRFGRRWLFLLPLGAALVGWFIIAPSPRFAGIAFWGLGAAVLGALAIETPTLQQRRINGGVVVVALLCVLVLPIQLRIVFPAEGTVFYPLPQAVLKETTSERGATYYEPTTSDQCWDAPLPCSYTYTYIRELCYRVDGDLSAGFAMGGVPHSRCDMNGGE